MSKKVQKPFLKWVGGKTQIIEQLSDKFPKEMENYHEVFLGGGSVLFALLSLEKQNKVTIKKKIYAYDLNETLIGLYKNVQTNKDELYRKVESLVKEYDGCSGNITNRNPETIEQAKSSKESYYYWCRNNFNILWKNHDKTSVEASALFMFLNKTCFRGMYREGPNGYNVPYGHYKKTPAVLDKKQLDTVSELIQNVEFLCLDFTNSFKNINAGDFVYLDPPYAPESSTSFVKYTKDGFDLDTHKKLFKMTNELTEKKIMFMMSNANVELVKTYLGKNKTEEILCRRAINSKKPDSTAMEVIITNY